MENKSGMYHKPPSNPSGSNDLTQANVNSMDNNPAAFSHSRHRGKIKVIDDAQTPSSMTGGDKSMTVSKHHSIGDNGAIVDSNTNIMNGQQSIFKGEQVKGMKNPLMWAWGTYIIMWIISLVGIFFTLFDQFCDPNKDGSLCQDQATSAPTTEPTESPVSSILSDMISS